MAFTGTKYAAQLYINQLSDEEVRQLAEGMTLTPADTETASVWDDSLNREEGNGGYTVSYDIDKSRMQLYQVGESGRRRQDHHGAQSGKAGRRCQHPG